MEEQERKLVLDKLEESRDRLLGLVEGLTVQQWTFRPGEGRWSIGECLEHVTRVEGRVAGLIGKQLENPPEPDKKPLVAGKDEMLARTIPDRSMRIQAPEPARPLSLWTDPEELVEHFRTTRESTRRFTEETERDLRNHFIPHLVFGDLDCYQWLLAISLHGERHAQQIEEIKAASAFPAGELTPS